MSGYGDDAASRSSLYITGRSPLGVAAGLAGSLGLHAILLLLFAMSLRGCGDGSMTSTDGEFRNVGIYVKQPMEQSDVIDETDSDLPPTDSLPFTADPLQAPLREVDTKPPIPLPTPQKNSLNSIIGPGPGAAGPIPPGPENREDFAKPGGKLLPAKAGGLGPGETKFFIRDKGKRFVYVIDNSSSMARNQSLAFRVAKSQLIGSLQSLGPRQQFQIIFYNEQQNQMSTPGQKTKRMYLATAINRTLARQFIAGIQPTLGTDHMPALKLALDLKSDVIFFLTDAGEPFLDAGDLNKLRKLNGGRARINCIEFGEGRTRSPVNFLTKLARQNGGKYQYYDVTEFGR